MVDFIELVATAISNPNRAAEPAGSPACKLCEPLVKWSGEPLRPQDGPAIGSKRTGETPIACRTWRSQPEPLAARERR
jgi:hypothetical protein